MMALLQYLCSFSPLFIELQRDYVTFPWLRLEIQSWNMFLCLAVSGLFPWYLHVDALHPWPPEHHLFSSLFFQSAALHLHLLVTTELVRWVSMRRKHLSAPFLKISCWVRNIVFVHGILSAYFFRSKSISSAFMQNERIIMNTNLN